MDISIYRKISNILTIVLAFGIGVGVMSIYNVHAQNQTTTNAPIVNSIDTLIYTMIVPIVLSILAIVKQLIDKGYLDKRWGTAVVMAADNAHAIGDTREVALKVAQNSYEIAKIASPEAVQYADTVVKRTVDEANEKLGEYKPKIQVFENIAKTETKSGKKTVDEIKEIKDEIPNEIVPS